MKKVIKISFVLSIVLLSVINVSQFNDLSNGEMKLTSVINKAIADEEGGSCCTAFTVYDHCGMKKDFPPTGACCKASTNPCDMCTMTVYKAC